MERNRRNWIYVLGSAEQRDLIESLREGLTRSQLSVYQPGRDLNRSEIASYRPAIDLKEDDSRIEQLLAVQLSIAIVVLATPELYQDEIAVECLNIAEYRRAKVIYVELEPSRKLRSAHSWRVHAVVQKPVSKIQLVKEIARRVRKVLQYVSSGPRKPHGRRGRYVFISYSARNHRLRKEIVQSVETMGMNVWDYGKNARNGELPYKREIDAAIWNSRFVLFVLTAAWQKSPDCRREYLSSRRASCDRVWLRCERTASPPWASRKDSIIDLRAQIRKEGLLLLERHLFPTRRKSKLSGPKPIAKFDVVRDR